MGGNLSCFGSAAAGSGYGDIADDQPAAAAAYELRRSSRKVRPSDEDRLWYVGERDVDRKAAEFIAKFHASARFVEA
ncbi:uncharacterized protein [Oryza sativa Japonica Group]|uniref:Uncharacterized protein n=5 Tax=Oryza TaxID=4527 RepID=A0A8J8YHH7_ORYSJ|nr:uncharacterized protein LOC107278631 [Oryza sativa Japonica Group]EEC81024.1 hypothetical protein OsI_23799 [Oryza sativa Indica Group]KAB8103193.1 hypothetical protein EE612_035498 [Oryza sativa]EEE66059.1 hypothetical protein OsJ_22058 [Oryza sativa Japonica Group]KAF2927686.1 hypothetical protein DAI22_06g223300 [Oryza sativa Japonica Group]BAS98738.1 Os06g0632400 [Oryza sativa Japonica Group]